MVISIHHPRYIALRQHLRMLRKGAKLSQIELAERLGEDQSYISKIERGERYVDLLFYLDWSRACGMAPEAGMKLLLDGERKAGRR
jgi:transcriptional regulator with XRE-family HTH domain